MKRVMFIMLSVFLLVALCRTAHAEIDFYKWNKKFFRGLINMPTSVFEIPKQAVLEAKETKANGEPCVFGLIGGTFKGIAYTGLRFMSGFWDVATPNINFPAGYEPAMKPDYVFGKE